MQIERKPELRPFSWFLGCFCPLKRRVWALKPCLRGFICAELPSEARLSIRARKCGWKRAISGFIAAWRRKTQGWKFLVCAIGASLALCTFCALSLVYLTQNSRLFSLVSQQQFLGKFLYFPNIELLKWYRKTFLKLFQRISQSQVFVAQIFSKYMD